MYFDLADLSVKFDFCKTSCFYIDLQDLWQIFGFLFADLLILALGCATFFISQNPNLVLVDLVPFIFLLTLEINELIRRNPCSTSHLFCWVLETKNQKTSLFALLAFFLFERLD